MILEREMSENNEIPVEEYVGDVLVVALYVDGAPTSTEYEELGRFSETSGRRKFGTWDNTLGMVCSKVFDMRVPLGYSAYVLEETIDSQGRVPNADEFTKKRGEWPMHRYEWKAIQYEAGCDVEALDGISEKVALEEYREYRQNSSEEVNEIEQIFRGMSEKFERHPSDYARHFSTVKEADALAGLLEDDIHYLARGRGTRYKLDNMIKLANLVQSDIPVEELPVYDRGSICNLQNSVHNSLPDSFFESRL